MENKIQKNSILLLLIIIILCFQQTINQDSNKLLGNYLTTSTRIDTVNKYCQGVERKGMISDYQKNKNQKIINYLADYFKLDSVNIVHYAIRGNYSQAYQQVRPRIIPLALFIIPFVIGLIITLLIWPFLLCCSICYKSCPPSLCRNDDGYSRCQLKTLVIILIIFLIISISASIFGIIHVKNLETIQKRIKCTTAVIFDDFINGNISQDTRYFFVGFQTLNQQLSLFVNNSDKLINTLNTISSLNSSMIRVINQLKQTFDNIEIIPNLNKSELVLYYNYPFDSNSSNNTISSTFPKLLGINTQKQTLIGTTLSNLNITINNISQIKTQSDIFINSMNKTTRQFLFIQSSINNYIDKLKNANQFIDSKYQQFNIGPKFILYTSYSIFGIVIGLAMLIIFASISMNCFKIIQCRYVLFGSCGFIFILTVLGFIVVCLLSLIIPSGLATCFFLNDSLNSKDNFRNRFNGIITDRQAMANIIQCLPTSNGDLVGQIVGIDAISAIQSISHNYMRLDNFLVSKYYNNIQKNFANLQQNINSILTTKIIDLDNNDALIMLEKLSRPIQYSCSTVGFKDDSWIPSNYQNKIQCKVNKIQFANLKTCPSTDNFNSRNSGCRGCMDTTSLFSQNESISQIKTSLTNRYSSSDCLIFIQSLSNTWNNYYHIKNQKIKQVKNRYINAQKSQKIVINSFNNQIIQKFKNITNQLKQLVSSIIDNKYGLSVGLNCKIFGYNIQNSVDNLCLSLIPHFYISFIVIGIISFALLLSMCLIVSISIKHYKQYKLIHTNMNQKSMKTIQTQGIIRSNSDL